MIREERLRRKGWSEAEIAHALRAAPRTAEWTTQVFLALLVGAGGAAGGVAFSAISRVTPWYIGAGVSAIIGACIGALAVVHSRAALAAMALLGGIASAVAAILMGGQWLIAAPTFVAGLALAFWAVES